MNEIIIFPNNKKLICIAAGSAILVFLGCLIIYDKDAPINVYFWSGYVGVPFFGVCFLYSIFRMLRPSPSLVINQEGILDNASALGAGFLRWSDIKSLEIYTFKNQRFLGITPHDLEEVLSRQNIVKRCLFRMNLRFVEAPFNIPQVGIVESLEEILKDIEEYRVLLRAQ